MRGIIASRHGGGRPPQEAGAALFQGLRVRLTLWYCAVLCAALVLFGVALYIGAQYFLISPLQNAAAGHAHDSQMQWLVQSVDHACQIPDSHDQQGPPHTTFGPRVEIVVCFDRNGSLLPGQDITGIPSALTNNTLALEALRTGQAVNDTVDAAWPMGQSYLYALPVPNQNGSGYQGVVMVGESIQAQETALSLLLTLLLVIGGVALLGAGLGGLFLANRALAPARLAWANQQRFIADASHELRTPLTLLRADAEVLLRGRAQLARDDVFLLEDIVAEVTHMTHLAENMLMLARLDNRAPHREHEVVNLAHVAREDAQRMHALADEMDIAIQVEANDAAVVIGDPTLLQQAVLALLDNAIKYNHRGGRVTVRTAIQDEHALLEVRDTGIGISTEHLSRLGERFYRVDKARSREAGGTGLGLSIVHGIAISHGGSLTLKSVPEQGTTATLTLPLAHGKLLDASRNPENAAPEQTTFM
jgi:signal transduction histidine kinase